MQKQKNTKYIYFNLNKTGQKIYLTKNIVYYTYSRTQLYFT
jgi:hypothetical protein